MLIRPTLILLACCLLVPAARAERADRNRPVTIEADDIKVDDAKRVHIITGNPVVTKGTLVLRGARIELREDAQGYYHATVTALASQRAFYRQKREGLDEYVEGEAETIEYDGKADRITLTRRAELRTLRAGSPRHEVQGAVIVWDNLAEELNINGQPGARRDRVRAVLQPNAAASAAAGASSAALRSSQVLGGDRK